MLYDLKDKSVFCLLNDTLFNGYTYLVKIQKKATKQHVTYMNNYISPFERGLEMTLVIVFIVLSFSCCTSLLAL